MSSVTADESPVFTSSYREERQASFGMVMTKSSSLTQVSNFIAKVNREKPNTVRSAPQRMASYPESLTLIVPSVSGSPMLLPPSGWSYLEVRHCQPHLPKLEPLPSQPLAFSSPPSRIRSRQLSGFLQGLLTLTANLLNHLPIRLKRWSSFPPTPVDHFFFPNSS